MRIEKSLLFAPSQASGEGSSEKRMWTNEKLFRWWAELAVHVRQGNSQNYGCSVVSGTDPRRSHTIHSSIQQQIFVRININCNSCDCNGVFEPFVNGNGWRSIDISQGERKKKRETDVWIGHNNLLFHLFHVCACPRAIRLIRVIDEYENRWSISKIYIRFSRSMIEFGVRVFIFGSNWNKWVAGVVSENCRWRPMTQKWIFLLNPHFGIRMRCFFYIFFFIIFNVIYNEVGSKREKNTKNTRWAKSEPH